MGRPRTVTKMLALCSIVCGLDSCERYSRSEKYYFVTANTNIPHWKSAEQGFQKAAAEYNVSAQMVGPEQEDADGEADALVSVVAKKPTGILISVIDAQRMVPVINSAVRAGVPVITGDSDAPASSRLFFIGTNNFEAGHLGAQRLMQLLKGRGNIVFFSFPTQPNLADRLKVILTYSANMPA